MEKLLRKTNLHVRIIQKVSDDSKPLTDVTNEDYFSKTTKRLQRQDESNRIKEDFDL